MTGDDEEPPQHAPAFDLTALAREARPREVTGATFSYVDALLAGRMSQAELAQIRDDILGDAVRPPLDPIVHVKALLGAGDHAAALHAANAILEQDPTHEAARALAAECRDRLADVYQPHVGAGHDVPRLAISLEALGELGVDRWAAYLISRMHDGTSIDDLVDLTGFTRLDTLRILYELIQRGVVAVDRRAPAPTSRGSAVLARVKLTRST